MKLQVNELLELQGLDTELGKLQQAVRALERGERVERTLALRTQRFENARRRQQDLEAEQRLAELELKSVEEKKHQTSRRLYEGRITAPRELQALEMEVGMLDRQRQRLDDQILKRMEEIESAQGATASATALVEEATKALAVLHRRYEKEAARLQAEMDRNMPARSALAARIDPETLRRYESIRRRNHNVGAVRIQNGACGGCRMKVGQAVVRRIHAGDQYVYCESCSCFLFDEVPSS